MAHNASVPYVEGILQEPCDGLASAASERPWDHWPHNAVPAAAPPRVPGGGVPGAPREEASWSAETEARYNLSTVVFLLVEWADIFVRVSIYTFNYYTTVGNSIQSE